MLRYALIVISCLYIAGCAGESAVREVKEIEPVGTNIPPNHIRITGTVVSVDENYRSPAQSSDYKDFPCLAVVRIDEVHGYGSAVGQPLAKGREIPVFFTFGLNHRSTSLAASGKNPGIGLNDRFTADVEEIAIMREGAPARPYKHVVQSYKVK